MRPIDADEIEYESVAKEDRNGGFHPTDIVEKEDIDKMPTIEAIPISWLFKENPIAGVAGSEDYFRKAHYVRWLIDKWRKEQKGDEDETGTN